MQTSSVLYIRDSNSTVTLPEGSQKLKTEMTYADFINDWKTSWFAMNDMITNHSSGKLNDQLVPKGCSQANFHSTQVITYASLGGYLYANSVLSAIIT